jgi:hypothetical protein
MKGQKKYDREDKMNYNPIQVYEDYAYRFDYRKKLYQMIAKELGIKSAIYPGCHVDIAPSLYIPKVVYIDNFKGAIKFFKYLDDIKAHINQHKEYTEDCNILFFGQDYTQPIDMPTCDLIISQFAGFVGQETKQYLRLGGYLLCNDSHGDATLARFDKDFKLVGVIDESNTIDNTKLEEYFVLPNGKNIDLNAVKNSMKGLLYSLTAENFLFQKVT